MVNIIKNSITSVIKNYFDYKLYNLHIINRKIDYERGRIGITTKLYDGRQLIVSLTSYSHRIYYVHEAIESILQQTLRPNKVILWLSQDEFKGKHLPITLTDMQKRGLEIRFCPDYKSYKKLLPSLQEFPEDIIITIDDDIIYPRDLIERLYFTYKKDIGNIVGGRCRKIRLNNNQIAPYLDWEFEKEFQPSCLIFPTGCGGILYPPDSFPKDVFDWNSIQKCCPTTDDIWFKFMSLLNNKAVSCLDYKYTKFNELFLDIQIPHKESLINFNTTTKGNDKQIRQLLSTYPACLNNLIAATNKVK